MTGRGWLAAAIVAVGGTMWLWLPGPSVHEGGPLEEVTAGFGRFHVPPGRARVEWVMLVNSGDEPIRLSSARLGVPLHGGARVLGTAARDGRKVFVGVRWPPPVRSLRHEVDGYVVAPGRSVSIAFGLSVPFPTRLVLEGVQVRYRAGSTDYRRSTNAALTLCVTRRSRCPARSG